MSDSSQFVTESFDDVVSHIVEEATRAAKGAGPYIIGISGGSASGKTTLARQLAETLGRSQVAIVSQDDFQLGWDFKEQTDSPYRWDDPRNFTPDEVRDVLFELRSSRAVSCPRFDLRENLRVAPAVVSPAPLIIFEGLYALMPHARDLLDVGVYVDAPYWGRLIRRTFRFTKDVSSSLGATAVRHMMTFVRKAHIDFVRDQMRFARVVLHDPYDFEAETAAQFNLSTIPPGGGQEGRLLDEFVLPSGVVLQVIETAGCEDVLFVMQWEGRRVFQCNLERSVALLARDIDWFER